MLPTNSPTRSLAFTLVELLVVIAIIAVLLSILLPSLKHAQHLGRQTICATNLSQIRLGLEYYANAHRSRLPAAHESNNSNPRIYELWTHKTVRAMGLDYIAMSKAKEPGVLRCGSNKKQWRPGSYGIHEEGNSYHANGWHNQFQLDRGLHTPDGLAFYTLQTRTRYPAQLYLVYDGSYYRTEAWHSDGITPYWGQTGVRNVRYAHFKGINMLFADGHVAWQEGPLMPRGAYRGGKGPTRFENGIHWYAY